MNFLRRHFYLFAILLLLTFGCRSCDTVESTKIAQSEIYQDYAIEATASSTNVIATFRVGGGTGTTVDLDAPSKIEHNGKELTENSRTMLAGTNYSFNASEFVGDHQFVYTNGEGRVFRNGINFTRIDPVVVPTTIKPKEKFIVLLSRTLGENESIETTLTSDSMPASNNESGNNSKNANAGTPERQYTMTTSTVNHLRNAVEIGPDSMRNFAPGKASIKFTIRGRGNLQEKTDKGGSIEYTYRTGLYNVDILK